MSQAQATKTPDKGQLSPEAQTFYTALGMFNTNVVDWYLKDPGKVDYIIDWLVVHCPDHAAQCASLGAKYMWQPETHACVRVDGEPPDGGPVG